MDLFLLIFFVVVLVYDMFQMDRYEPPILIPANAAKKACKWNDGKKCPHTLVVRGNGTCYLGEKSLSCCKFRQQTAKIQQAAAEGRLPLEHDGMRREAIHSLRKYKENFPEEYAEFIGKDY